jgi:DNA-binding CsgD family transcriptional regulator
MTGRPPAETQEQLYAAIEIASGKVDLARILHQIGAEFGFAHATLMIMPAKADLKISNLILESDLPREFFSRYDEIAVASKCPLFGLVQGSILPASWSIDRIADQQQMHRVAIPPMLELYSEFGLRSSTLLPLSSIDGARHLIRLDGARAALRRHEVNDLHMLALHFFDAYDRSRYPLNNNPCGLTERELEVMRWTATGKTSSEIGQILALSDHTVNAYMNHAFKKLDCVNRTQLVAKAIRMRVIS